MKKGADQPAQANLHTIAIGCWNLRSPCKYSLDEEGRLLLIRIRVLLGIQFEKIKQNIRQAIRIQIAKGQERQFRQWLLLFVVGSQGFVVER